MNTRCCLLSAHAASVRPGIVGRLLGQESAARCRRMTIAATSLLLGFQFPTADAQSAIDGFDPSADARVYAICIQTDGKILIGGMFTQLSPNGGAAVTRNRIARLNPDGTLDIAFNPNANGIVHSIALQSDGKVLVAGEFTNIGGQARNRVARLDPATGSADLFDPNVSSLVWSVAVQSDGKVLIGGFFTTIAGETRNNIGRVNPDGTLDGAFNPDANSDVVSMALQSDGKILVGGFFSTIGGQARSRIARLDRTTGLADDFNPNAQGVAQSPVWSVAVQPDGKILAAGFFTSIGGQTRNYIARLDAATGLADSFEPNPNGTVFSIAVQSDGKIVAGGQFTAIGGQTRNRTARLDAISGGADGFDPNANSDVLSAAVQADGKILLCGDFNQIGGAARNHIARITMTATPTPSCSDDTWTDTDTNNSPEGRAAHTAIWTGSEMIVWGGRTNPGLSYLETGARYRPDTNTWTPTTNTNAPAARQGHTAVWTGSEMIVWGGNDPTGRLNTGGRYNPDTDTWIPISTTNAPSPRVSHTAVWTGSEMIVWGGANSNFLNTGARYNPITNTWTATATTNAPQMRANHTAVWTGSEMIVWGGTNTIPLNTGARYDPTTDSWVATNIAGAPDGRQEHTALWTGNEMIVWGGVAGDDLNTGGRYIPATNGWIDTTTIGAPTARRQHTTVWTGTEMIVWGGYNGTDINTGGRYELGTNTWTDTSIITAPTARHDQAGVWTDREMIVWGGLSGNVSANTGGRYCALPLTAPTSTPTPPPILTPTPTPTPACTSLNESFDNVSTLIPGGWYVQNNSQPGPGPTNWFQGNDVVFPSQIGPSTSYVAANFNNGTNQSTLSNWLLTPAITLRNGAVFSFRTRSVTFQHFPDRLQVRMSTNGVSTNVGATATDLGDFQTLLLDINPAYGVDGEYPSDWTQFTLTITGQPTPVVGRLAFRYFVENGGPDGVNSDYIGIDTVHYVCNEPTPTPTTTPTPTPTPTCLPISQDFDDITTLFGSGWVQTNNSQPGPGITNWFQGSTAAFSAQSGVPNSYVAANYDNGTGTSTLSNWLLTPPLTLENGATMSFWTRTIDTPAYADRLQVRMSTNGASAEVGTTATSVGDFQMLLLDINSSYTLTGYPNVWTQFTVTVSEVPSPTTGRLAFRYFVENGGPLGTNSDYIGLDTLRYTCSQITPTPTPIPTPTPTPTLTPTPTPTPLPTTSPSPIVLTLPTFTLDASVPVTPVPKPVVTTEIPNTSGSRPNYIGFQGDFTYDSAVINFATSGPFAPPIRQAGLTGGNWNVNGNVLNTGPGTIKTLRISAFSNDFTPLTGAGTLFEIRPFRVSSTPGESTQLVWAVTPNNFLFIDDNLEDHTPTQMNGLVTIKATVNISGNISYCSNPVPGPVPNVTLTLSGSGSASTFSDSSGSYQLSFLSSGGTYTLTPTKATRAPGSPSINTIDAIAVRQHFLNAGVPLSGCRLTAANVNGDGAVNTVDVIAIQRFFLGFTTGIGNVGKYQFDPSSRIYSQLVSDQTAQDYDTLVFGDVASHFVE